MSRKKSETRFTLDRKRLRKMRADEKRLQRLARRQEKRRDRTENQEVQHQ